MLIIALLAGLSLSALLILSLHYALRLMHPSRQTPIQTPAELGLDATRVEFPARDCVMLRGWWIPSERPHGTIIFSHGYSGDCSPDLEYAAWLTREGYNLLYFDHRAHGLSDGNLTTLGFLETRDLLGAIDFLSERGIQRVGVLGLSMGGSVVLQTAPLTDAIRCVVADCTFADLRTLLAYQAPQVHVPVWFAPLATVLVLAWGSLLARCNLFAHTPEKSIGQIAPRPVLLIQAGRDELVPPAETARLYVAANEPKELWLVEEAGHRVVDKLEPIEYERRITAFFDRYLSSSNTIEAVERYTFEQERLPFHAGMGQAAD